MMDALSKMTELAMKVPDQAPMPTEIMNYIAERAKIGRPGSAHRYIEGAIELYQHVAPILRSLELSIIQRDHNWKRIYDQLQEREKEAADLKESLNHAAQLVKTDRAMIAALKTEIADYRKALEEIKTKGTSLDGTQIIYTQGAVIAMKIIDQYHHTT